MHLHTVGDAASRVVLDAVELARKDLGENYHVRVTCAHLKFQHDDDIDRFAKLGVFANYTPFWHCEHPEEHLPLFGEKRTFNMYRCKSVWDTGAVVTWSCGSQKKPNFPRFPGRLRHSRPPAREWVLRK